MSVTKNPIVSQLINPIPDKGFVNIIHICVKKLPPVKLAKSGIDAVKYVEPPKVNKRAKDE
jgi:hypothetical protein